MATSIRTPWLTYATIFALGSLSAGLVFLGFDQFGTGDSPQDVTESRQGEYGLINPLLECSPSKFALPRIKFLERTIKAKLKEDIKSPDNSFISLYYRDLNNGPWFGLNEKEIFRPFSLGKIPLLIGVYKLAEKQPGLLEEKVLYDPSNIEGYRLLRQLIEPEKKLKVGQLYSIDELITQAIVHSDNGASMFLIKHFGIKAVFEKPIFEMGLGRYSNHGDFIINALDYGSFFRILYNSSYLNREMSNRALELLSASSFKEGLVAGVPKEVTVAHKFGEGRSGTEMQFHDCGIIYTRPSPYLLCIMTKGTDLKKLITITADVSKIVFNWSKMEGEKMKISPY